MKLHLPKLLLSAVLALMVSGQATALTRTEQYGAVTFDTNKTYTGVDYSYDKDTGTLTINKSDLSILNLTFTLNYDAFDALTATQELLYVNWRRETDSGTCGLRATADATVTGNANGSDHAASEGMTATTLAGYITTETTGNSTTRYISGLKASIDGTTANTGTALQTSDDQYVYKNPGLRYTTSTFSSAYINNSLISSVTLQDKTYTYSNGKGWTKTFAVGQVTDATTSPKLRLTGGDNGSVATNTKPIVVGGSGALHLEAWEQGIVNLDDDLYLSSSTYNNGAYDNVNDYGVVRISNDGDYTANLSGNIYLVEDSSIKVTGTKLVNISGLITDKGVPSDSGTMDGDYTLTLGGSGINVSGKVDVGGLNIVQRFDSNLQYKPGTTTLSSSDAKVDKLTVGTNATLTVTGALTVGSTVSNQGTIDLSSGSLTFENLDAEYYDREAYYNETGDSKTVSANGYTDTSKLLLAGGNITVTDSTQITGTGLASWENVTGTGLVGTLANGGFDDKTFYVNSGTVRLSTTTASSDGVTYSDNSATTYVVKSGATLDVYFKNSEFNGDYALVDRTILLENGATLTNTGDNGSSNLKQLHKIELTGDATVNATSDHTYGFLAANYGESTLTLNGHTLEKTGNGEFHLLNTTATAGTIKITEGTVRAVSTDDSNASETDLVLNGAQNRSANVAIDSGITLSVKSLSGTGSINGGGQLSADSVRLNGSLSLTGATLKTSTLTKADGTLTIGENGVLDIRTMHSNLAGGYNGGDSRNLNDLLNNLANVSTSGNGYVWATGCTNASYTGDDGNINLQENAELSTRLILTNNLGINGKAWQTKGVSYSLSINEGGELQVGDSGTGTLSLVTGAKLAMTNSRVTAGAVVLGHNLGTATQTEDGKAFYYHGTITMSGEDSKLKVDKITFNGSAANAVTITGGEVEFTNTGNVQDSIIKGADSDDAGTVTINDTRLIANNSWALKSDNKAVNIELTDVTFDIDAEKTVTLDGSQVKIGGSNTVEGGGKLDFGGNVATYMKDDAASISVSSGSELTWAGGDISVKALGDQAPAMVSGSIINSADINVSTDSYIEIEQGVTGNSNLSVNEGLLAFIGVDTLEIHDLMIKSEAQVKVGSGAALTSTSSGNGVKVTGTADLSGGATVSGLNLNNATALTLNGIEDEKPVKILGEFSMNTGTMSLDGDIRDKLARLEAGWQQELFSVSSFTLNGESITDNLTAESGALSLDMVFKDCDFGADYYLGYLAPVGDTDGIIYIGRAVPEPATATLSLLALAALVARRRRK